SVYPMALPSDHDPAKSNALRQQEIGRLEALPEIRSVALTDFLPLSGTWTTQVVAPDAKASPNTPLGTLARHISPAHFETLGIPSVRGRTFTREEARSGAELVIVSAALARQAWPGEDALGKKIKMPASPRTPLSVFEVVGIAGDVRSANISRLDP